jgi:4-hydroxybenzoate polyprenyltransferase
MKLLDYFFAARPLLHLPVWSIYIVSWHLAHQGQTASLSVSELLMPGLISLAAAGAYYLNQVYDFHSDRRNRKLGFLQRGLLTKREMIAGHVSASGLALAWAALESWSAVLLILLFITMGILYSAPPFRFKDRPVAGLLANAFSFGALVSLSTEPTALIGSMAEVSQWYALYFTLAVAAVYLMTTLPDRDGDESSGKKTLAVVLPPQFVRGIALAAVMASGAVAYSLGSVELTVLSIVAALAVLVSLRADSNAADLFAGKLPILLLTLLAGYYYPWYLLFVVALVWLTRSYYRRRFSMTYPRLI